MTAPVDIEALAEQTRARLHERRVATETNRRLVRATSRPPRAAVLLRATRVALCRYVVFASREQATACALWVLHTYIYDVFETTPYLAVTSAVKRSGKSRLLELLSLMVARPWYVAEPSEAALFRKVEKDRPTLLVDEVDATFGKDSTATEGLRAIYNSGYRKGATVPRCVGASHDVRDFAVFCPKVFAGIKALPDTVADRSIPVVLRRRAPHERKPARFRLSVAKGDLASLVDALDSWAKTARADLEGAGPPLPEELSDRAQDGWEPMLAIADLAGRRWGRAARRAAIALQGAADDQDLGVVLLVHCRDAFGSADKLTTADLLRHLVDAATSRRGPAGGRTTLPAMPPPRRPRPASPGCSSLSRSIPGKCGSTAPNTAATGVRTSSRRGPATALPPSTAPLTTSRTVGR